MKRRERLVDVADTRLLLREWGEGASPVLFWHGLGDHTSMQMVEAAPILAAEFGFSVIGVDAPGFGGSPRLPDDRYAIPALVDLARELLDALDIEGIPLTGASWGAILGVHFAARHPERVAALVLLDGGYLDPASGQSKTLEELREHWRAQPGFRYESWEKLSEDTRRRVSRWSPALEEYVHSAFHERDGEVVSIMGPDVFAAAIRGLRRSPPSRAHARLGETGLPVLLLAATEPPEEEEKRQRSLASFAKLVPQADVRRVEHAPHLLLEERPGEIARTVGGWLSGVGYE